MSDTTASSFVRQELVPERPEFAAYSERIAARAAVQRAEARDKELGAK